MCGTAGATGARYGVSGTCGRWVPGVGYTGWVPGGVVYRVLPCQDGYALPLDVQAPPSHWAGFLGPSLGSAWEGPGSVRSVLEEGHSEVGCAEGPAGPGVPDRGPDAL